jgi:hypothetical protein
VAALSKAWIVFVRSNAGIVGSNSARGIDVCVHLFCVCALLCVGSGLAKGSTPSKGCYRLCIGSRNWKSGQGPAKGFRAIIIITTTLNGSSVLAAFWSDLRGSPSPATVFYLCPVSSTAVFDFMYPHVHARKKLVVSESICWRLAKTEMEWHPKPVPHTPDLHYGILCVLYVSVSEFVFFG